MAKADNADKADRRSHERREPPTITRTITLHPHVLRCHVEPGDVVVVECPTVLTVVEHIQLTRRLKKCWPGNEVLILDGGRRLMVGMKVEVGALDPR